MNIKAILKALQIIKRPEKDWSKSDRVVLDNFAQLRKRQEDLQILPLNKSSYGGRRFYNNVSPDFQGPSGYAGQGTQDRMPGTTPQFTAKPTKVKRPIKRKGSNYI